MNRQIFREYDIRGLVDRDLTTKLAQKLGKGLGTLVKREGGRAVVVGRDCRESSIRFRDSLCSGLISTGLNVLDLGIVPTPLTYFAANTLPVDGLAMITGSHNPPEYNGFKVGIGKSTLHGSEIQRLRRLIENEDFEVGAVGRVDPFDIVTPYHHFVRQTVRVGRKGMRIVVDAGNGTGGVVAVPLFRSMGFEVIPLFCEMDASFANHHPDPAVTENLAEMIAAVNTNTTKNTTAQTAPKNSRTTGLRPTRRGRGSSALTGSSAGARLPVSWRRRRDQRSRSKPVPRKQHTRPVA